MWKFDDEMNKVNILMCIEWIRKMWDFFYFLIE